LKYDDQTKKGWMIFFKDFLVRCVCVCVCMIDLCVLA